MSSNSLQKSRSYNVDPIYQSRILYIFVNRCIRNGKKSISYRTFYSVLHTIQQKAQGVPIIVVEQRVRIVCPVFELRHLRIGGALYQVPVEVSPALRICTAIRWILNAANTRQAKSRIIRLVDEIIAARCGIGGAVIKREEVHRIVESNKAFSRYNYFLIENLI
jgi:small subunit ribosomal protein S7